MPNNDLEIESLAKASDEYDQEQLDISLSGAIRKNPEQSAKAYNLAQQKGLPIDYVERNYDKASAPDVSNVGPNVAQLLRDRKKSAIAYDDIDNLSWWEDAARETGNIGKIGLSGAYSISAAGYAGLGSTFNALSDITLAPDRYLLHLSTEDEIKDFDFLGAIGRKMMQFASEERAKAEAAMPTKTVINPAVMGGIKSVVMNAPALAAGVLARSPKVALGAIGGATYGDAYLTAKESGLNESSAITYAANQAIAEVATESIPAARLLKDIGANAGFFKTIAAQMATEIPGEQVATIWQDALDWAALHPEKTLKEFMDERPDAAVNTLISTIVATGIQTGAIAGIDKLGRGKESEQIQAIADKANESKVNGRVPEIFSEHVQNVADEYGAPDAVYLDAKEARALFQSLEQDAAYNIIAEQIDEAEAVGGDIVIPIGEFASKVATSKNFDLLKESFRLSPESPTTSQASNQPERITALLKEAGDQVQLKSQADQIHKEVTDQLVATGRMNKDTAKASASIIPAYVTSMASRTGLPVDEVYGMMGLSIEGQGSAQNQAQVLAQSMPKVLNKEKAQLLIDEISGVSDVSNDGLITVYHRTSKENADKIRKTGIFTPKEDGIFFSTKESGQAEGFGDEVVSFKIPADKLELDDIFDDEAHLRLPSIMGKPNDISQYIKQSNLAQSAVESTLPETITIDGVARSTTDSTGRQIATTEQGIKNFYKWFGESKVVDKDGKPIVVYHGTASDFDSFSNEKIGANFDDNIGFYFTNNTDHEVVNGNVYEDMTSAGAYAKNSVGSASIIPSYVSLKNPLIIEGDSDGAGILALVETRMKSASGALQAAINKGHDGVIVKDTSTKLKSGEFETVVMAHLPTQIKSAIGNKGTFDPSDTSILNQSAVEDKNLFVVHNLSAENILAAAKLGGLAVPSLAVARSDIGFDNFGEVTLIADPSILSDNKARTFDSDVYSPRQPRSIYDIDAKKYRDLLNEISADASAAGGLRIPDADRLSDGANELLRSEGLQYHWLKTQGLEPKIVKKKVPAELKGFIAYATKNNITSGYDLQEDEGFKKLAEAQIKKASDEIVAEGMESPYYDDGILDYRFVQQLADKTIREINKKGVDKVATQDAITKKMRNKDLRSKFEAYAIDVFNDLKIGEKLFKGFTDSGNRKYAPYTMENVVKEMTTTLQGGEKSFYGAGSVRSKFSNELNTLKKIQQNRNKIISEADFDKIKEQSNNVFMKAMDDLKPYYKFDANSLGYMDDAGSAIIEGAKGIRDTFKPDPEVNKIINDLKEYLSALPTHYFESKIQRAVGFNEFNTAIVPKDISKTALKVLEDAGLKIKKYDPSKPNSRNDKIAEQKGLLFQEQSRGSFDPKTNIIKLGQASDLSTFAHELGHMFLEMEGRLYNHPNATPEMKADGQVILDWLEIESFDRLKDFETDDKVREAHEKFARGFEKYLAEGKAPSIELKAVFRRFAAWMKQVYRDLRNLNVELNDNVRAVMDRMLATDEQINRARNVFDPLFSSAKDAGMTETEFKTYQMESSPDSAKEVLLAKMIKQLNRQYTKWWKDESAVVAAEVRKDIAKEPLYSALEFMRGGATTKEAKTLTADIEQLEEQLRKITRANPTIRQAIARAGGINRKDAIDNGIDPDYIKARFVSRGKPLFPAKGGLSFDGVAELLNQEGYNLDESGAIDLVSSALASDRFIDMDIEAQAENIRSELEIKSADLGGFGANRLNRDDVEAYFFGDVPGRFIGLTSKNGMSADDMAAMHGLASGNDLIESINISPTLSQKVKVETQAEMMRRHGDILNDGTIQEEAAKAVHNAEHAKKLLAELSALSRKTKTPAIDREAIKAYAKEVIGKIPFSKIRPAQYRSAEVRAAREAVVAKNKGDLEAAQKAKQQEVINFYLSREATYAKEKAEKIRSSQKAIQTRKYSSSNIDMEHVNEAKILLGAYDFRKTSDSDKALAEANIARVRHWIESQQKDPNNIATFVQAEILGKLISYKEMTLDDLVGLDDTVKSILHAGRGLAEENKAEYRKNIDAGAASIKENRIETYETEIDSSIPWVQVKNLFDEATASLRKLESFARQADGMNDKGWVWRNTVKPLLDAANEKLKRQAKSSDELKAIFKGFNGAFSNIKDIRSFTTESGKKIRLSYGSRLSMALNMGNEGNIDALKTMQSIPLTDNDISQIVGTLNESDWNLVQKVWDYIDTFWPEIAQLEIKRSGVAPQKVPGIPFMAPTGQQMKGGYYPLAGDSSADIKQLEQDVDTMASSMMNGGAASKSTKHGSTIERVGFGGKKIDFSIGVLFNHIDGVLHDLTHWQAVKDVDRVFKNEKISSELAVSLSKPGVKAMKQRLKEIAAGSQRIEGMGWINRILRHARMASTYSALGYSVRTALMNTMGLTTAIADMNAKQVARGAIEYYSNLSAMNSFILEKSEYMRDRGLVINRDIAQIKSRLKADDTLTKIRDGAFWMMTQTDKAITRPIWLAAYREGEMKFSTEKEAIDHADRMVARTQGSGMDLDLANVETRNELMKTMTVMYTAFSAIYNVSTEQIKRYKAGKIGATDLALKMAWLTIVPGILTQLITGSDDDEPEEYFWEILGQGLGMIPLVRDAYSYARYGASFPTPIMRLMSAPVKLAEQISQGEVDKGMVGAATELASWLHIPGGAQLTRSYGYLSNMQDGEIEEFSPIDLLITGKE